MLLTGQYADGSLPDTGWVLGPLLMSLGALHPSVRESGSVRIIDDRLRWWSAIVSAQRPPSARSCSPSPTGRTPDGHFGGVASILPPAWRWPRSR